MRTEILDALLHKAVDDLRNDELLTATEEELREALKLLEGKKKPSRKNAIVREIELRNPINHKCSYTDHEKAVFSKEWNRVCRMFR